jgi:hypothetical protein
MIHAVTRTIWAEKTFIVNGMIYEEINMIYTVPSMIYRHQYDSCSHQYMIWAEKGFIVNGMIYKEINMIYTISSTIYRSQHDL